MNYKLEKFWNITAATVELLEYFMNYKLEKFWNNTGSVVVHNDGKWTINLKSFEIVKKIGMF